MKVRIKGPILIDRGCNVFRLEEVSFFPKPTLDWLYLPDFFIGLWEEIAL